MALDRWGIAQEARELRDDRAGTPEVRQVVLTDIRIPFPDLVRIALVTWLAGIVAGLFVAVPLAAAYVFLTGR